MSESGGALAMCWYDEVQWRLLKARDPDALDPSYAVWRRNAARAFRELTAAGHDVRKVAITVDAWLRWCAARGLAEDAESRSAYAAWVLRYRGGGEVH